MQENPKSKPNQLSELYYMLHITGNCFGFESSQWFSRIFFHCIFTEWKMCVFQKLLTNLCTVAN